MPPGLEQCLELLKGERDEQRLAGLLLVPRLCDKNDAASLLKVYHAVGVRFLDRLLKTGRIDVAVFVSFFFVNFYDLNLYFSLWFVCFGKVWGVFLLLGRREMMTVRIICGLL